MPAKNSPSERSLNALHGYDLLVNTNDLVNTVMSNNLMTLHVHKDTSDTLGVDSIANELVSDAEHSRHLPI